MFKFRIAFSCCLLLQSMTMACMAQDTVNSQQNQLLLPGVEVYETGVLQNIFGYQGDVLGAEVTSVTATADNTSEVIEISVPVDPELVDRVKVVTPSGKPVKLDSPLEISRDPENDKVGITLRLSKKYDLGFKIRLIDLPDD